MVRRFCAGSVRPELAQGLTVTAQKRQAQPGTLCCAYVRSPVAQGVGKSHTWLNPNRHRKRKYIFSINEKCACWRGKSASNRRDFPAKVWTMAFSKCQQARKNRKTAPGGQHFGSPTGAFQNDRVSKTLPAFTERVKYTWEEPYTNRFCHCHQLKMTIIPGEERNRKGVHFSKKFNTSG